MPTTDTEEIDAVDTFTTEGLTVRLSDERMAEEDEHPAGGAIAYTVELYAASNVTPEKGAYYEGTYTVGPAHTHGSAKGAMWSLAGDAYAALSCEAPIYTTDISEPKVREALRNFTREYGYGDDPAKAIEAYSECVEILRVFDAVTSDPWDLVPDLYERLDG